MSVWTFDSFSIVAFAAFSCGCGGGQRDVVPETRDVTLQGSALAAATADAGVETADQYVHVAKRRHGVIALAEARGFAPGEAERTIDGLADSFEACATEREYEGKLVKGAARVVVRVDADGNVNGFNVRAAPGPAVAANLLLCIVAPLKAASFGPAAVRGFAIETEWEPLAQSPTP